jgi:hypothetical protein
MTRQPNCENCGFRQKYDNNPKSLLGRLWRWHAGWCPGFKQYVFTLPKEQRDELAHRYRLKRFTAR